ncbi:hypothetical protein, partial [Escherichia coli]
SLKTSIKTITYLSDIGCLEIQGASLTGDTRNISLVMTEADKALREAKSEGGNKVIIHHI